MKRILFLALLFSARSFAQTPIIYTPMSAPGYQYKYLKVDSGFNLPFRNKALGRGTTRPGAVVFNTGDSLAYVWNGLAWKRLATDSAGVIALLNKKVDSVTITGNNLFYWVNGTGYGKQILTYSNTAGKYFNGYGAWGSLYDSVVNLTGAQTIAGMKTLRDEWRWDNGANPVVQIYGTFSPASGGVINVNDNTGATPITLDGQSGNITSNSFLSSNTLLSGDSTLYVPNTRWVKQRLYSGYVPYTGAYTDLDLGLHGILGTYATFGISSTGNVASFQNTNSNGIGVLIDGGNASNYSFKVRNYAGTNQLVMNSAGATFSVPITASNGLNLTSSTTSDTTTYKPLGVNTSTKEVRQLTSWPGGSGGGSLIVGTTTIASGTSGRIEYNNAGVLGEMTTTGTGTVVALKAGPTFIDSLKVGTISQWTGGVHPPFVSIRKDQNEETILTVENQNSGTGARSGIFVIGELQASPATNARYMGMAVQSTTYGGSSTIGTVVPPNCGILQTGGDLDSGLIVYADDGPIRLTTNLNSGASEGIWINPFSYNGIIQSNPNFIGIGTKTPAYRLDVNGTARVVGHTTFEGVTSTGATGTGKFVYDGSPTLVTPNIGVATGTSLSLTTLTASTSVSTPSIITASGGLTITPANGNVSIVSGSLGSTIRSFTLIGTLNSTAVTQTGLDLTITGAGSGSNTNRSYSFVTAAGYSGSGKAIGIESDIFSTSTGNNLQLGNSGSNPTGNTALNAIAFGTTTGANIGGFYESANGGLNIGVIGKATTLGNSATNIGGLFVGLNTGTSPVEIGVYAGLKGATPTFTSSALMADNGTEAQPIFVARDNGSAKFTISDEGNVTMAVAATLNIASGTNTRAGNAVLVAGTVTISNTTVTANTIVILTRKTSGGTIGTSITYTVSAGTSFTITSDNILDTSTFSYMLFENN